MAREAGIEFRRIMGLLGKETISTMGSQRLENIERLVALVRADEAAKYTWDVHSCGPTCTKAACVAMREAVEAEREACAKVCEQESNNFGGVAEGPFVTDFGKHTHMSMAAGAQNCAAAIRARGETK
jgi:hypothetical protein